MTRFWRIGILCCLCLIATLARGQNATTSLRGVVKDPSGALVPGALVTITNTGTGRTDSARSDSAGFYIFPVLAPARYLIKLQSQGFAPQTRTAELLVSQPATIDFTLGVESSNVTVDVSSVAETLNMTDATMGNAVGNSTIEALPMDARNPISLLQLQPGVLYIGPTNTDSRQGAVAGGRSDQGNVTLDGLDDNDQVYGTAFTGILRSTLDSTEEFRVVTSNGTALAGRSSGAQVNLVTKSGTNHYHGSLYEYYRPTNTVSNDFFNKNSEIVSGTANRPQKYIVNTFGGSFGGPVLKKRLHDKYFYFFNYEGQRIGTSDVVGATVPTASFMKGELSYPDVNGVQQYLTPAQVAQLDMPCTTNTFNGQPVCPNGPGPNAAVLAYYANVPTATSGILGDGGYNSGAFYFTSPAPKTLNTSILKLDYIASNKNHLFVRGNLQKDTNSADENLPGQPPSSYTDDNTKGIAAGYTWTPTGNIVNDLRYGYTRQGYQIGGIGQGDYVDIYSLTQPTAQTRNTVLHVPVNNIVDTLTWVKGTHTISVGGNWRGITNESSTDANSFNGASTNPYYANTNDLPEPSNISSSFYADSWMFGWADLMGVVPEVYNVYNYKITSNTAGTALPDGSFVVRDFRSNEFEYFLQDSWHARSNLTFTYGLRHTILQTPYEIHGQQISPTIDTDAWYKERESAALKSQIYEPTIYMAPSGKANGQPGFWPKQKDNIAPRIGVVYSPDPRTSIRASFGVYYDHFGEALANTFSQEGSIGLSAGISNGADELGFENSPRFTGPNNIPAIPLPPFSPTISFPSAPPIDGFGIDWGIDNHLKTPYADAFNLSVQHEFPGGFVFEEAYVGRLGRHLLQQLDLAENTDYVDPNGGGDYFSAARQLSQLVDAAPFGTQIDYNCPYKPPNQLGCQQKVNNAVPTIAYFENVFPYMKNLDYQGESATQAIFNNAWAPERYTNGETFSLVELDFAPYGFYPGIPAQSRFFSNQFSSLYSWDTIGTSSYNALQFTLRHPARHGLTFDLSYTFSKSLDIGSETERTSQLGNTDDAYTNFAIQNTWNPKLNKGPSDFDARSLIAGDWVYELPVGRGKALLTNTNHFVDALLGGWRWAGVARWTSGLPFTLESPAYPSNYNNPGFAFNVGNVQTHRNFANGIYHAFDAQTVANVNNGIYFGQYIRLPYAGEAGQRNNFRGDGYFDIDTSMTKSWKLSEAAALRFVAEVYNVSNTNRFDVSLNGLNARTASVDMGNYYALLSQYRHMEFSLRLDF